TGGQAGLAAGIGGLRRSEGAAALRAARSVHRIAGVDARACRRRPAHQRAIEPAGLAREHRRIDAAVLAAAAIGARLDAVGVLRAAVGPRSRLGARARQAATRIAREAVRTA